MRGCYGGVAGGARRGVRHGARDGPAPAAAWLFRDVAGNEYKPEDDLTELSKFVRDDEVQIEAIRVLLDRPRDWSATALTELRQKLAGSRYNFTARATFEKDLALHGLAARAEGVAPIPPPNPEGTRERLEQHGGEAKRTDEPAESSRRSW